MLNFSSVFNGFGVFQWALAKTTYPDIPDNAIAKEEAIRLAANYLGKNDYRPGHIFFIGDDPNPIWKVMIVHEEKTIWFVEVDSITGDIIDSRQSTGKYYHPWMNMVPWKVVDEVELVWEEEILPSAG